MSGLAVSGGPEVVGVPGMDFGGALIMLRAGYKLARTGWNGRGMYVYLCPGTTFHVSRAPLDTHYPEGTEIEYRPHIDMRDAEGKHVPWLASQTDLLARDWVVVP